MPTPLFSYMYGLQLCVTKCSVQCIRRLLLFSARQHICYSALYAIARPSVRLSVCLSVRLSHGWISLDV